MLDVIIALTPAALAAVWFFGAKALLLITTCMATCAFSEWLCRRAMKRANTVGDLSAILTGLLLSFNLPPDTPLWIAAIGSAFAIVIVKQVFGGLGYNVFNPALAARAFLLVSFTGVMTTWSDSSWVSLLGNAHDAVTSASALPSATPALADAVTSATPLGYFKGMTKAGTAIDPALVSGDFLRALFVGNVNGCIGEVSKLALLVGAAYLLVRRVISWHTPAAYIATVAAFAAIAHAASPATTLPAAFHLLSGGLVLGAFFMATDMVTSPTTHAGQIVFGIGCGLLTMVIRTVHTSDYPEGVSFSILIMNAFVPIIDSFTRRRPFGAAKAQEGTK